MLEIETDSYLSEGINHLEDLNVDDFLRKIENISKTIISEKLDGANLWTGFDKTGKFYTTRAGKTKNAKFWYSVDDYPDISAYSGFKAAHLALEKIQTKLAKTIKPGQAAEVEILFGRQPNAVTYGIEGKSFIAFIRPVEGDGDVMLTEDDITELTNELVGDDITVTAEIMTSIDGETLQSEKINVTWKIVKTQTLDAAELKSINLTKEIAALKKYLNAKNKKAEDAGFNMTNAEVLGLSLTKIPKEKREEMKALRSEVSEIVLTQFKLPIKEKLLNDFVRKIKPKLQGTDLDDSEDTGIEGVVLRDPETHEQFKIVDKDVFTTVNSFNWGVRSTIDGVVKTDDPLADRSMRGGAMGDAKIRIANLLGMRELAKGLTAKRYLAKFKGKHEFDTAKAVADNIGDLNFNSTKTKIRAILSAANDEVSDMLKKYKDEVDDYKVELKNGKTVKYSPEIRRRTLTAFAETKAGIKTMIEGIDKADNFTALILVLYGKTIKALNDDGEIAESIQLTEATAPHLSVLQNMNADAVTNAYQATLFGTLLLLRAQDRRALPLIKDTRHATLKKYDPSMSQLNFWGLVLFNPDNKAIKPLLQPTVFKQLWKTGHRFLSTRIKNIHSKLSSINNFIVDWDDQAENLRVVSLRLENRTNDNNLIRDGLLRWPDLTVGEKEIIVSKVFYQLSRYTPTSPLIGRIRELANKVLLTANKDIDQSDLKMTNITNISKLKEDGEGGGEGTAPAPAPAPSTGETGGSFPLMGSITSSKEIASPDKRLFKNRVIIKRKRGYTKENFFARPVKGEGK